MSRSSSGGIGIGSILFWGWILWSFFGGGDDTDKTEVEVKEDNKPSIVETVKENVNTIITDEDKKLLKDELDNLKAKVEEAKDDFFKAKEPEKEIVKAEPKEKSDSIYGNPDDVYGNTKDKF